MKAGVRPEEQRILFEELVASCSSEHTGGEEGSFYCRV